MSGAPSGRHRGYLLDYKPSAETRRLLADVEAVLEEYQAHWPLTVRQIFYRLVGARGYSRRPEKDPEMARSSPARRLAAYQARYAQLASQLADVGFIAAGSVTHRYTRCASPGCRCNAEPSRPHGPYYQWTAKVNGKTVTRRLSEDEARLYQEWIANDRRLSAVTTKMRQVAAKATDLMLIYVKVS